MDFINKIFFKKTDDSVHEQFVRFGKGIYPGRAVIKLQKNKDVKISSSFEYSKDFAVLICELADKMSVNGSLVARVGIPELGSVKPKGGVYDYDLDKELTSSELKSLLDKAKYTLLNIKASGVEFKCKQKLPKPGKAEGKVDDKFCQLQVDMKYWPIIRKEFFPDISEGAKRVNIKHTYEVSRIVIPSGIGEDYEKLRLLSKRGGKIIRILEIDKQESKKETDFEA